MRDRSHRQRLRKSGCHGRRRGAPGRWNTSINPDMPWNEEIRAAWARHERLAASPGTVVPCDAVSLAELDVRAVLPTIRVPTLVLHHAEDTVIPPAGGQGRRCIAYRARNT